MITFISLTLCLLPTDLSKSRNENTVIKDRVGINSNEASNCYLRWVEPRTRHEDGSLPCLIQYKCVTNDNLCPEQLTVNRTTHKICTRQTERSGDLRCKLAVHKLQQTNQKQQSLLTTCLAIIRQLFSAGIMAQIT